MFVYRKVSTLVTKFYITNQIAISRYIEIVFVMRQLLIENQLVERYRNRVKLLVEKQRKTLENKQSIFRLIKRMRCKIVFDIQK